MLVFKLNSVHFWSISFILLFLLSCAPTSPISEPDEEKVTTVIPDEEIDRTFFYAGKPEVVDYPNEITVLFNEGYISGYDEVRGTPARVVCRVFHVDEYISNPRPSRFLIDNRTENRISHDDYTHSGNDRGHMSPNFCHCKQIWR